MFTKHLFTVVILSDYTGRLVLERLSNPILQAIKLRLGVEGTLSSKHIYLMSNWELGTRTELLSLLFFILSHTVQRGRKL